MNLNDISLPYPVLGINDDVFPPLEKDCIQIEAKKEAHSYVFDIVLKQENKDILCLLEKGFAEYVCEVNCPRAYYRKCFASESSTIHIEILKNLLCRDVSFTCFVIVKKEIIGYTNKGFHPDYRGFSFDMERGDILVAFGKASFSIDIEYDKLQTAGAFMQIREGVDGRDFVAFNVANDKIEILLPAGLYKIYANKVGRDLGFSEILHSSLVLNALVYALQYIKDYPDTLWARTLKYRKETESDLQKYDLEDESSILEFAQVLLKTPYKRMFNRLCKMQEMVEEDGV